MADSLNRKKKRRKIKAKDIARMEAKYGMPMYKKNPDKYAKKRPWIVRFLLGFASFILHVGLICGVIGIIVLGVAVTVIYGYTEPELLAKFEDQDINMSSVIYALDENGDYVEYETLYSSEHRTWATSDEISDNLKNAAVAIEDKRFYLHMGVDPITTSKAVINYTVAKLTHGNTSGLAGGSTLTQQLIKNITGEKETTPARKIEEMLRACYLERNYSKEQILEFYLNTVYFGNNQYGVQTAAQYYYGKDAKDLDTVESAALVSITKNPSYYDPFSHPDHNKTRRIQTMWEMYQADMISEADYDKIKETDIVLRDRSIKSEEEGNADWSYATDMVFEDVVDDLMSQYGYTRAEAVSKMYTGGLQIYSTIQLDVQNIMEDYFENPDNYSSEKFKNTETGEYEYPETAMIVMDPSNGDIIGVIGGRGEKTGRLGLNRATQSLRQPGSSIKPLTVYGLALENNTITLASAVDDYPVTYEDGKAWPSNFDGKYRGLMSVYTAITYSYNAPAVRTLQLQQDDDKTYTSVFNFAKNELHLVNLLDSDNQLAPLSIGAMTKGLTVREMTRAYTVFANHGNYTDSRSYTRVDSYSGKTVLQKDVSKTAVFSEQTAYLMTYVLQEVTKHGFATSVKIKGIETAGKTGTTSYYYDRWFIGYTPYYLGGIWYGYDNNHSVSSKSATQTRMWGEVMSLIHKAKGITSGKFERPSGITEASYCVDSGMKPSSLCSADGRGGRVKKMLFKTETVPSDECKLHHTVPICTVSGKVAHDGCASAYYRVMVDWVHDFGTKISCSDSSYLCPTVAAGAYIMNNSDILKTKGVCTVHSPSSGTLYNGGGYTPSQNNNTDDGGGTQQQTQSQTQDAADAEPDVME